MRKLKRSVLYCLILLCSFAVLPVEAGDIELNINTGSDSTVWFISGEASLVMNGFDLTPLGLTFPATIDRVSIDVNTPVPGASIDLLIYEDSNGGSPIDARLVSQTRVNITESGLFTYDFSTPVVINQPVVWIGFYLPVDFRFLADTSGASVLTYWAWTSGGRFSVNDLSSAQILGPSDGSAPVNINMDGKARITAEITGAGGSGTQPTNDSNLLNAGQNVDRNIMIVYPEAGCDTLFRDVEDLRVIFSNRLSFNCRLAWDGYAPGNPSGYQRKQLLYEIYIFDENGNSITGALDDPVTHCIEPNSADLEQAVVGVAFGAPRKWEILTTVRYGDLACAEVNKAGYLAYFIPG
ncbi:MAG: hypothetical protein K8L99_21820 [Anaerolineae bacterium]|nr:hypothetical protein [Anaerolineae bacterium]